MKSMKTLVSMLVVLSMMVVFAGHGFAIEKTAGTTSEKSVKSNLININTAGVDDLIKLPRIGEKMARRIIEYRQQNGKFKKPQDLMNVKGIGEKTFKGMEDMVTI